MSPKIACADFAFPLLPHDHVLDLIAMLELGGVDVALFQDRSHLQPSREFKNVSQSAKRLANRVADRGLKVADIFMQVALDFRSYAINNPSLARRRKAREWFLRTLEYASICGTEHVTTLPGVRYPGVPLRDSWALCCDELSWRVDQARGHSLTFSVEPLIGSIISRPKTALQMVNDVPGLTLTLDYSHFAVQGIPDAEVEPLVEHASHFHVRGARRGRIQVPFDRNAIAFERVCKVAKKRNYQGWFEIEYNYADWERCNECDTVSETIKFRDFLRKVSS